MTDCITFLAALAGHWEGSGVNHEGQQYRGALVIDAPINATAMLVHFVATGLDGTVFHRETLMVGGDGAGNWQALSASSNIPGIMQFSVIGPIAQCLQFAFGNANDMSLFREEITFRVESPASIFHGYAWAMPGEAMQERSSARLARQVS